MLMNEKLIDIDRNEKEDIYNFFHQFVQNPHHSFCYELKRFGGHYN